MCHKHAPFAHHRFFVWALFAYFIVIDGLPAQNFVSRRDYTTPGLVVETGARTGTCDVLTWTRDGRFLLAAGDDKVVRNWELAGTEFVASALPTLRWHSWQEHMGRIYAMALSPDNKRVAIGGHGMTQGQVAVLDRETGKVLRGVYSPSRKEYDPQKIGTIWAMHFSADGNQVAYGDEWGNVWLWEYTTADSLPRKLGTHPGKGNGNNLVKLVRFLPNGKLISLAEDGHVIEWNVQTGRMKRTLGQVAAKRPITQVVFREKPTSAIVVASDAVRIYSFPEIKQQGAPIGFQGGTFPQSMAINGNLLAIGLRAVDVVTKNGKLVYNGFYKEFDHRVLVYDLRGNRRLIGQFPISYRPDALAFHPQKQLLAVAGGAHHETSLWALNEQQPQQTSVVRGLGRCIWEVAVSENGSAIGFTTDRVKSPTHPNRRGAGDQFVFHLSNRSWAGTKEKLVRSSVEYSADGWQIHPDPEDPYLWWVGYKKSGETETKWYKLAEYKSRRYGMPRCYTFLPKKDKTPTRLVIGHDFGASMYELWPGYEPYKVRLFAGHHGEVMSLAATPDQTRLVTGGRDQTISGWSLEDWPSHPVLGALLTARGGRLWVDRVDAGSPLWEVGLQEDDEIVFIANETKDGIKTRYNATGNPRMGEKGSPENALKYLKYPVSGRELAIAFRRGGKGKIVFQKTTLKQRPVWRFFPTEDKEWVLWRWRDYYYSTSTHGDRLIGFQQTSFSESGIRTFQTPKFHEAEVSRSLRRLEQTLGDADVVADATQYGSPAGHFAARCCRANRSGAGPGSTLGIETKSGGNRCFRQSSIGESDVVDQRLSVSRLGLFGRKRTRRQRLVAHRADSDTFSPKRKKRNPVSMSEQRQCAPRLETRSRHLSPTESAGNAIWHFRRRG